MDTTTSITPEKAEKLIEDVVVKVWHDDDPLNPRKDYDHVGTFVGWHGRYNIGDEQPSGDPSEWWDEVGAKIAPEGGVILPVFMLDHGSVHYSTRDIGDVWDSGQVGWIYATADDIRKGWVLEKDAPITAEIREKAEACLRAEICEYTAWANGDVWGFTIEGGEHDGESVGGFFNTDTDSALDAMKGHVPDELHAALEEAWGNRHG